MMFDVVSVNISEKKGTSKKPVPGAEADLFGLAGDAHRDVPGRSLSILDLESIDSFRAETGIEVLPGDFGENLTVRGVDLGRIVPGNRLLIGDVVLEVMVIGKVCHGDACSIFSRVGRCIMPSRGVFCRVVRGGMIRAGAPGSVEHGDARDFSSP